MSVNRRIRCVKPEFFDDGKVCTQSIVGRFLIVGLWSLSDDEGRFRAEPVAIASALFMPEMAEDPVSCIGMVSECLRSIAKSGIIVLYGGPGGEKYGAFPKWHKHQKINKPTPSRLPPPPSVSTPGAPREASPQRTEDVTEDSGSTTGDVTEDSGPGSGIVDQGPRISEEEVVATPSPARAVEPPPATSTTSTPDPHGEDCPFEPGETTGPPPDAPPPQTTPPQSPPPAAKEPEPAPPGAEEVVELYRRGTEGTRGSSMFLSPLLAEKVRDIVREFGVEITTEAIHQAVASNNRGGISPKFVGSICARLRREGMGGTQRQPQAIVEARPVGGSVAPDEDRSKARPEMFDVVFKALGEDVPHKSAVVAPEHGERMGEAV